MSGPSLGRLVCLSDFENQLKCPGLESRSYGGVMAFQVIPGPPTWSM